MMYLQNNQVSGDGQRQNSNLYAGVISTCFAFLVLCIRHYDFIYAGDLQSYINYVYSSPIVLFEMYEVGSFFSIIPREPIWLIINTFLGYFLSPDNVVNAIAFFASFTSAYLIIVNNKTKGYLLFILLILFLPVVLSKYTIHLRQGLAVSVFMIWYYSFNRSNKILIPILLPFIHSSFFVILCVIALNKVIFKFNRKIYLIIFFVFSILVSLVFLDVASLLGARQTNNPAGSISSHSGLNFIYWLTIFLVIIAQGSSYFNKYRLEISFILLYLVGYYINPYASRIFESTLIIIFPILMYLKNDKKDIALVLIISYFFLQYLRLYLL